MEEKNLKKILNNFFEKLKMTEVEKPFSYIFSSLKDEKITPTYFYKCSKKGCNRDFRSKISSENHFCRDIKKLIKGKGDIKLEKL